MKKAISTLSKNIKQIRDKRNKKVNLATARKEGDNVISDDGRNNRENQVYIAPAGENKIIDNTYGQVSDIMAATHMASDSNTNAPEAEYDRNDENINEQLNNSPSKLQSFTPITPDSATSSEMFKNAKNTNIHHSTVYNAGRDVIIGEEHTNNIKEKLALLKPISYEEHYVPQCMEGTRKNFFVKTENWLNDFDSSTPNIMWITGYPGTGKSAISSSLISKLSKSQRLYGYHFFKRDDVLLSDPCVVWRTIAATMASKSNIIAGEIVNKLDNSFRIQDIEWHFENLIGTSLGTNLSHDPVVIIDAVDECELSNNMHKFLNTLVKWSTLSKRCKILVTSRPGHKPPKLENIEVCVDHELEVGFKMGSEINHDINFYLQNKFEETYHWMKWMPKEEELNKLVQKADGLFIYASTVVEFITSNVRNMVPPRKRLQDILQNKEIQTTEGVDNLYIQILNTSFGILEEEKMKVIRDVLSTIILAKVPLEMDDIQYLISGRANEDLNDMIVMALNFLKPVLAMNKGKVTTRYLSFVEFLTDRCKLKQYKIEKAIFCQKLMTQIFAILNNGLKFNICNLNSSYQKNEEVKDLDLKIKLHVQTHLQYCCLYWPLHQIDVERYGGREKLTVTYQTFVEENFLYWLEVMSLMHEIPKAFRNLKELKSATKNEHIEEFLNDSLEFLKHFNVPISKSAPHIYISALPFSPRRSVIFKLYNAKFPNVISRLGVTEQDWRYKEVEVYDYESKVNAVAYCPQGENIVVGLNNYTLIIINATTGEIVSGPLEGHTDYVTSVAFSPDGTKVVSGSHDKTLRIWEVESGNVISQPFVGHTDYIKSVGFSTDGKKVVSGSWDKMIRIWDVESGSAQLGPLEGHTHYVTSVAFSPDGTYLVSGSWDRTVRIWDATSGKNIFGPFECHEHYITSVAFCPDGKKVASSSWDKTIRIIDIETGTIVFDPLCGHTHYVTSVALSSDGKYVASGSWDKTVRVWDIESGTTIAGPFEGNTNYVTSVAFSPDGRHVVSGSWDNTVRICDVNSDISTAKSFEGHTDYIRSISLSSDGNQVVSGSCDKTVRIWDLKSGRTICGPLEGHTKFITSVAFSPNGNQVASGSWDKTIRIWNIDSGTAASDLFEGHTDYVRTVAFSPNGKLVASGSHDLTVRIWDVESGKTILGPLEGHTNYVTAVKFSPNGSLLASGSWDKTIRIWDIENGSMIYGPFVGHTEFVRSVSFSPDGTLVASASHDKTARIWDIKSGATVVGPLLGHAHYVVSVAFSPDGKQLVSSSWDKTMQVWDVKTGTIVAGPFEGHTHVVTSVTFSPDGLKLVSTSWDRTLRVWDVRSRTTIPGSLIQTPFSPDGVQAEAEAVRYLQFQPDHVSKLHLLGGPGIYCSCHTDGWVKDKNGNILFWVPDYLRSTLCDFDTISILGHFMLCRLDLSKFCCGEEWISCFSG